jgi:hypothetical protein
LLVDEKGRPSDYNVAKQSRNYCTKHTELKAELERGLGIER